MWQPCVIAEMFRKTTTDEISIYHLQLHHVYKYGYLKLSVRFAMCTHSSENEVNHITCDTTIQYSEIIQENVDLGLSFTGKGMALRKEIFGSGSRRIHSYISITIVMSHYVAKTHPKFNEMLLQYSAFHTTS